MAGEIAQVMEHGQDANGMWRRVRLTDGSELVQRGRLTVEGTITRADGTVERGGEITDIRVEGVSQCA